MSYKRATRGGDKPRRDVYEDVSARMVAALEAGTVPWRRPWSVTTGRPRSLSTGQPYRGINTWLLGMTALERGYRSSWWGTHHAIAELGGHVMKGQNQANGLGATLITLWKTFTPRDAEPDPDTGEIRQVAMAKFYPVFNSEQTEGLPEKFYPKAEPDAEPVNLPDADKVIAGYLTANGPGLAHDGGARAFYSPAQDKIHLPPVASFDSPEARYATTFHEMAHSTGHPSRNDRPGVAHMDHFGTDKYSREELVAEMGSAMLAAETGVETSGTFDASARYLNSWISVLKGDKKLVIGAASAAQKAADTILEPTREAEQATEVEAEAA